MTNSDSSLTHLDKSGQARMVDVGGKDVTVRMARAGASIRLSAGTLERLRANDTPKGDVFATARIAGIQAAKRTSELIPLCHHVALTSCRVSFELTEQGVEVEAEAHARDRTGVEMEALTAATVAALTIYDMLKAIDKGITIEAVCLLAKDGGRSGSYRRD